MRRSKQLVETTLSEGLATASAAGMQDSFKPEDEPDWTHKSTS
jgi:hypothetical protein